VIRGWLLLALLASTSCVFDRSGPAARSSADGTQALDTSGDASALDRLVDHPPGLDTTQDLPKDQGTDQSQDLDLPTTDLPTTDLPPPDLPPDLVPPCIGCPLGCQPGTSTCRTFGPSNVSTPPPSCGDLTFTAAGTVDTSSCQVTAGAGTCAGAVLGQLCVLSVGKLTVPSGVTVALAGNRPLVVVASDDVTIQGTLDGAANGAVPGPGGFVGGEMASPTSPAAGGGPGGGDFCDCTSISSDDCGGGGGGFGSKGGNGGMESTCAKVPAGGDPYGNPTLIQLQGGSGGATPNNSTASATVTAAGGGGGGVLQISSQQRITVTGAINLGGGGGQGGKADGGSCRAAAGGGSGGAVLLEAPEIAGNGWVAANGGGGGGATCGYTNGGNGEDGHPSASVAQGGTADSGSYTATPGGDGAAGASPAKTPANTGASGGGGGGGGGLGRIRLNWYATAFPAPTLQTSGALSTGTVTPQ
jgi:hypothetical protein